MSTVHVQRRVPRKLPPRRRYGHRPRCTRHCIMCGEGGKEETGKRTVKPPSMGGDRLFGHSLIVFGADFDKKRFDRRQDCRDCILHGLPNTPLIDAEVDMYQSISHPGQAAPGNIGATIPDLRGNVFTASPTTSIDGSGFSRNVVGSADIPPHTPRRPCAPPHPPPQPADRSPDE